MYTGFSAPPEHRIRCSIILLKPAAMAAGDGRSNGRRPPSTADPVMAAPSRPLAPDEHHLHPSSPVRQRRPSTPSARSSQRPTPGPSAPSARSSQRPTPGPARLLCNRPTPNPSPSVELPITIQQRSQAADHTASITSVRSIQQLHSTPSLPTSHAQHELHQQPISLPVQRRSTPASTTEQQLHPASMAKSTTNQRLTSISWASHELAVRPSATTSSSPSTARHPATARHHAQQLHAARPPDPPTNSVHAPPPPAHVPIKSNGRQTNPS
ncbi:hypothetical protein ACLOJK_022022 [Asimina triloba]